MWKYLIVIPVIIGIMIGALVVFHLIKVGDLDVAWRMTRHDFSVMAKCPLKPDNWYSFLKRSELGNLEHDFGHLRVPDYAAVACAKGEGAPPRL